MIIGISGGMGAGKSTLARFFEKWGAILVDADRIGHAVIERPPLRLALKAAFGREIERPDGSLDRRALGRQAFADEAGKERLNEIVQPPLELELWKQVECAHGPEGGNIVVVDAALIFEWDRAHRFDVVVVVFAAEEVQIERVAQRQNLEPGEIRERLAAQMPAAEKISRADFALENNGSVPQLEKKAARLWTKLVGG
ncbi:MAG: dephospho-CoA kinase [Gemmatimonadetes bacterium]|nr:dephospho-CoA kinase [Gemmatimonadota bacterium]